MTALADAGDVATAGRLRIVLLAEELALIAIDPETGRHKLGTRDGLKACLAALLLAEVAIEGDDVDGRAPTLTAAAEVLAEKRGKVKSALSHMSRGLDQRLGVGTWDAVLGGLVAAGAVASDEGGIRRRYTVLDVATRDSIVERLRAAAASDEPMPARTAVLLSMTGPAQLLELVSPDRSTRKHARKRIDGALDSTSLEALGTSVRKVLSDAAAGAAVAASVAALGAASS